MLWQDYLLTIINITFSLALFPQVISGFKEKKGFINYATSIPTFIGLYIICFVYLTLNLYLSAGICLITGTLWFLLFIQRWKYGKK